MDNNGILTHYLWATQPRRSTTYVKLKPLTIQQALVHVMGKNKKKNQLPKGIFLCDWKLKQKKNLRSLEAVECWMEELGSLKRCKVAELWNFVMFLFRFIPTPFSINIVCRTFKTSQLLTSINFESLFLNNRWILVYTFAGLRWFSRLFEIKYKKVSIPNEASCAHQLN